MGTFHEYEIMLKFAGDRLSLRTVFTTCDDDNTASVKVLENVVCG